MANTHCSSEEIASNTCKFDVNEVLGIKGANDTDSNYDAETANSPDVLLQDIFLTATMLIGTIVTVVLVVSGVKYIIAGSGDAGQASAAKKGIKNAVIGLAIVSFSYTIVRVIQYLVSGYR